MQSRLISKHLRIPLFGTLAMLAFYFFKSPSPPLQSLPGTYQYFTEIDFQSKSKQFGAVSHSDARFAPPALDIEEVRHSLVALFRSYVTTMDGLGIETWIAHGTLLGWYWGRKIFPWDTDIDVQVSAGALNFLATKYNMTQYRYRTSQGETRTYLLDINPHYSIVSTKDVSNKIDARWIDIESGKYVDITAVHPEVLHSIEQDSSALFCKDGHRYVERDIYPLQKSTFEDIDVNIPFEPKKILQEEYSKRALVNHKHHWYEFDDGSQTWKPEGGKAGARFWG